MPAAMTHALVPRRLAAVAMLVSLLVGCAVPAPIARDGPVSGSAAAVAAAPRFAPGGPDADEYGIDDGFPTGDRTTFFSTPFLVGSHSELDRIFESRLVRAGDTPSRLARAPSEPVVQYYFQGAAADLDLYLLRNPTTGLLVARDDTILVERYQYGRNDRHRFTSWSMAKTVTSMLVGIAIAEGRIRSVDDPAAAYVPGLVGTEYGRTSLRDLLQMSSGVRFVENYSGRDDVAQLARDTFLLRGPGGVEAVTRFNDRAVPAGTKFSYASVETQVLGLVLRNAVGRPVAEYLSEKIWRPIGAEADATWLVDQAGQEATYCCINAVLRDYARLGLLLAHDGNWRGRRIVPTAWIREATTVRPEQGHLKPGVATPFLGYGYQTWILPGDRRMFLLSGVRGQAILIDPASRLVLVHTAVRKQPAGGSTELRYLWQSLVTTLAN
ncbi:MAG: serine hydrolase [Candidatus Rokuibacteriota bacterium]|nr:MAG: serine hydrolase [Candidatus Rokubacteria bacterium]